MATQPVTQAESEVLDFLLRRPSLREIAEFKLSPEANERIDALLDANRNATISDDEREEVERYLYFEHFMRMLKIKAYRQLGQQAS